MKSFDRQECGRRRDDGVSVTVTIVADYVFVVK
jgi:hypothetical protein